MSLNLSETLAEEDESDEDETITLDASGFPENRAIGNYSRGQVF